MNEEVRWQAESTLGLFDLLRGKARAEKQARQAELRGDLARAVELFAEAAKPEEAARIVILRGDSEPDPRARLLHYTQASRLAPADSDVKRAAHVKRAELVIALAQDSAISASARKDLLDAAKELEDAGEAEKAAVAYRLARDTDGEARALEAAGDVERLEFLLFEEQQKSRVARDKESAFSEVEVLVTSGRRREALERADSLLLATPEDLRLRERAQALRARMARGPVLRVALAEERYTFVLGNEVTIGRSDAVLTLGSAAISRTHLGISRSPDGVFVKDLGSRNGTLYRGVKLASSLRVTERVELRLGREVPFAIEPAETLPGAMLVELGGEKYLLPLGPARLPIPGWTLTETPDGWVELVCGEATPAFAGSVSLAYRTTLLIGDAIGSERGGEAVLRVLGV